MCSTRHGRSNKEKTKCLASSVQKLWKGSQNLKSRSRDLGHAPFGLSHGVTKEFIGILIQHVYYDVYTTCIYRRGPIILLLTTLIHVEARSYNRDQSIPFVSTKVSNSIMALYKSIYLLTFLLTYLRNLFSSRDETETDKFLHNSTNMALRYCQADHLHYITLSVFHVCTLHKTRNLFANKLLDNNVFTVVIKGFISNLVL